MEGSTIVDGIGLIILPIIGWILYIYSNQIGAIDKKTKDNADDISAFRLHVSETYSKKDDLSAAMEKIDKIVEKIFEKLDKMAAQK
jgi:hypothetical protein